MLLSPVVDFVPQIGEIKGSSSARRRANPRQDDACTTLGLFEACPKVVRVSAEI
ncbi:MAG: hypothetical protein WA923_10070 [Castellaniella sp.]